MRGYVYSPGRSEGAATVNGALVLAGIYQDYCASHVAYGNQLPQSGGRVCKQSRLDIHYI